MNKIDIAAAWCFDSYSASHKLTFRKTRLSIPKLYSKREYKPYRCILAHTHRMFRM